MIGATDIIQTVMSLTYVRSDCNTMRKAITFLISKVLQMVFSE